MKFLTVNYHDNDFALTFREIGEKILAYYTSIDYKIEFDDYILSELKQIIIKMVSDNSRFKDFMYYLQTVGFTEYVYPKINSAKDTVEYCETEQKLKELKETYKEGKTKHNYEEYFKDIELEIVDVDLKNIEWNNCETLYIPLEQFEIVKPFCM